MAVPVKVNEVDDVMLSVFESPESDAPDKSGVVGAVKTYLMTTTPLPPAPPEVRWLTLLVVPPSQAAPPPPPPPVFAPPLEPAGDPESYVWPAPCPPPPAPPDAPATVAE